MPCPGGVACRHRDGSGNQCSVGDDQDSGRSGRRTHAVIVVIVIVVVITAGGEQRQHRQRPRDDQESQRSAGGGIVGHSEVPSFSDIPVTSHSTHTPVRSTGIDGLQTPRQRCTRTRHPPPTTTWCGTWSATSSPSGPTCRYRAWPGVDASTTENGRVQPDGTGLPDPRRGRSAVRRGRHVRRGGRVATSAWQGDAGSTEGGVRWLVRSAGRGSRRDG